MSLIKLIEQYDWEHEAYIKKLKAENEKLREQLNETTSLLMSATAANERKQLQLILAGAFDRGKTLPDGTKIPSGAEGTIPSDG